MQHFIPSNTKHITSLRGVITSNLVHLVSGNMDQSQVVPHGVYRLIGITSMQHFMPHNGTHITSSRGVSIPKLVQKVAGKCHVDTPREPPVGVCRLTGHPSMQHFIPQTQNITHFTTSRDHATVKLIRPLAGKNRPITPWGSLHGVCQLIGLRNVSPPIWDVSTMNILVRYHIVGDMDLLTIARRNVEMQVTNMRVGSMRANVGVEIRGTVNTEKLRDVIATVKMLETGKIVSTRSRSEADDNTNPQHCYGQCCISYVDPYLVRKERCG